MERRFARELVALGLPRGPGPEESSAPVTAAQLAPLPEPVRRYLDFMGVPGRPRDWSFRLTLTGRFRRRPDEAWMPCRAVQYNTRLGIARIFHLRIRFRGLLPLVGRDTYLRGRGRMRIRALGLVTVGDGTGEPYDIGELTTYLNDGIFIAPSLLLGPEVRWTEVDGSTFDVDLTDHGRTVRARVGVDERGAPVSFETDDRFMADPKDPSRVIRTRWSTPCEGWQEVGGHRLWVRGRAVWHLPAGDFTYVELAPLPASLAFNVPPGE